MDTHSLFWVKDNNTKLNGKIVILKYDRCFQAIKDNENITNNESIFDTYTNANEE